MKSSLYRRWLFAAFAPLCIVMCSSAPVIEVKWVETPEFSVWRGEKTHAKAVITANADLKDVTLTVSGDEYVRAQFILDVKGDVFADRFDQSGPRRRGEYDSIIVADRIAPQRQIQISSGETRPVWVSIDVPSDAKAGVHGFTLKVKSPGKKTASLKLSYEVADDVLPDPSEWTFQLDLWQNPYSVARYYGVPLWSEEHFALMKPLYERLAEAGQKGVTATIIDRPWNGQTQDPFGSMVVKTLDGEGNWKYDYTIFDRWVEFMFSLGIDKKIDCFTLLPWKLSFDYVDSGTGETKCVEGAPGTPEFDDYWSSFIKDLASHLRARGWFEKTRLGMDERPDRIAAPCVKLIRSVEPEFKLFMAAKKYPEGLQNEIADLCVELTSEIPDSILQLRRADGFVSTYYTCCSERYPNVFIASVPQEAAWLAWYALAHSLDGYYRWAYNSWTENPDEDARFRRWPAGDCYIVYPEASSVRFENLVEGIRDYEKASILIKRWKAENNSEKLDALNEALSRFSMKELGENGPQDALRTARRVLDDK